MVGGATTAPYIEPTGSGGLSARDGARVAAKPAGVAGSTGGSGTAEAKLTCCLNEAKGVYRHAMAVDNPEDYGTINALLLQGELAAARDKLDRVPAADERYSVLRVKLGLYDQSLAPGAAQQRLIQLMRRHSDWPGARELYQEASNMAYEQRESSAAHSHPPPPLSGKPEG